MTTPTHSAPLDLVTTAVLNLLRGTGRTVYDGAYAGSPTQPAYPYAVLYRIPGGSSDPFPDLDANPREATVAYQVTAVSSLRNQCEATGRQLRDRVLTRNPDGTWLHPIAIPNGWQVIRRTPDDVLPGVDQTGQPPSAVFSTPFRFHITVAPS